VIAGVECVAHYLAFDLPHSDDCFVVAFRAETTEAFLEGHVRAFAYFGGVPTRILYDNTSLAVARILSDVWADRVARIDPTGHAFLRYGLVLAIGGIAGMKRTEYEANGIQPLIAHSPLISWGYSIWTVHHFTMIIGAVELVIEALIAVRSGVRCHRRRHWEAVRRINAVAPAVVETPINSTFLTKEEVPKVLPTFNAFHPLGRLDNRATLPKLSSSSRRIKVPGSRERCCQSMVA
jgi:hypothetical protein